MKLQDQVYNQIQSRISRICRASYIAAPKRRDGRLKQPLTYPVEVDRLLELQQELLTHPESAERIHAEITTGEIQYKFLQQPHH